MTEQEEWYQEIEEGIRDIVKLLRNNGINTECSCEHQMYIQFQVFEHNDTVSRVDYILFNAGYRDYIIEASAQRDSGFLRTTGTVYFPSPIDGKYKVHIERTAAMEQFLNKEGK